MGSRCGAPSLLSAPLPPAVPPPASWHSLRTARRRACAGGPPQRASPQAQPPSLAADSRAALEQRSGAARPATGRDGSAVYAREGRTSCSQARSAPPAPVPCVPPASMASVPLEALLNRLEAAGGDVTAPKTASSAAEASVRSSCCRFVFLRAQANTGLVSALRSWRRCLRSWRRRRRGLPGRPPRRRRRLSRCLRSGLRLRRRRTPRPCSPRRRVAARRTTRR